MQLLLANPSGLVLMRLIISETLIGTFFGLMARFYVLALEFIYLRDRHVHRLLAVCSGAHIDGFEMRCLANRLSCPSPPLLVLFTLDFHHVVMRHLAWVLPM